MMRRIASPEGRVLCLDVGDSRIGTAISDDLGLVASPAELISRDDHSVERIRALVKRYSAVMLLVGLPTHLSGREGHQAEMTRTFAEDLSASVGLPLVYWDERYSSVMADRMMIDAGVRRDKRKARIDSAAAAIVLQSYLDAAGGSR